MKNILRRIKSKIESYTSQIFEDKSEKETPASHETKTAESVYKNMSTNELISRLNSIANNQSENNTIRKGRKSGRKQINTGAMCYCPSPTSRAIENIKSKILSYISQAIEDEDEDERESNESSETKTAERINKNTTTDELISRLRNIANDPTEYAVKKETVVMCYCPTPEAHQLVTYKCVICNRKLGEMPYMQYSPIVNYIRRIKSFRIAQVKIVCADCLIEMCLSGKYRYNIKEWDNYDQILSEYKLLSEATHDKSDQSSGINDIDLLKSLLIRTSDESKDKYYIVLLFNPKDIDMPHLTVTSIKSIEYLLAFLSNNGGFVSTKLLRDNINTIERLTGLKL